jgi:hypothetical protein
MESQIVVDHSGLDQDGFRHAGVGTDSREMSDIGAEMWSLELRAASRDNEANNSADDIKKYILSLESRELRKQARALKSRHTEAADSQSAYQTDAKDFIHFGAGLATE